MGMITNPYKYLYSAIDGRSRRQEFWVFTLYFYAVMIVVYSVLLSVVGFNVASLAHGNPNPAAMVPLFSIIFLAMFPLTIWIYPTALAHLALSCRRMHDQNRSAWWLVIGIIPFLGWLVVLIFMLIPGTPGPNAYGPDPKNPYNSDTFS